MIIQLMKQIICALLMFPALLFAQKDESFAKFINEDASVIKGSSLVKLYERQIAVYTIETNASANSTAIKFVMNTEAATAVFRDISISGKKMRSGEIAVTYISYDRRFVRYKINMENIAVTEVTDTNGSSTVKLNASRIGWTYYSYTKNGLQTIGSKSGWDAERRTAWTSF
jgi:type VI protein secretion system component Hcp